MIAPNTRLGADMARAGESDLVARAERRRRQAVRDEQRALGRLRRFARAAHPSGGHEHEHQPDQRAHGACAA